MIAKLVRRFLNLLFALNIYSKCHKLVWDVDVSGDVLSSNKFYSGFKGRPERGLFPEQIRNAIKNTYSKKFLKLLKDAEVGTFTEFSLVVFYHTRHDCDNISLMSKILVDTMKGRNIKNDGFKIYKSIHIIRDDSVQDQRLEIFLIGK